MGTTLRERLKVPVAALAFGLLRFIDLHPCIILLQTGHRPGPDKRQNNDSVHDSKTLAPTDLLAGTIA